MRTLTILASSDGNNLELAKVISTEAANSGFSCEVVNLVELELPLYSSQQEKVGIPDKAKELTLTLIKSDAIAVTAPEYNGSIPPALNNAIAWISRSHDNWREAFNAKPVLIATHSGGGGAHALMAVRQQLSYIGANVLGRQILTNYQKEVNIESLKDCLKQL